MSDATARRRREKYSKLICLKCRARRIRCNLPDGNIQPSPHPQPPDKACRRCKANDLDCIVDYTILGRPSQKRQVTDANAKEPPGPESETANEDEDGGQNLEDFLLSNLHGNKEGPPLTADAQVMTAQSERFESLLSPTHMMASLLARDKQFASALGQQPYVPNSILEVVDENTTIALDPFLVWHRLHFPNIPPLPLLRARVQAMKEHGQPEWDASMVLLTLLYDLALDVPSDHAAPYRRLQPPVRALLQYHGPQLIFLLPHCPESVLILVLMAQYRPVALTNDKVAGTHSLKAIAHVTFAKQIAHELGWHESGTRLKTVLYSGEASPDEVLKLISNCIYWVRLCMEQAAQDGVSLRSNQRGQLAKEMVKECVEALHNAAALGRIPSDMLLCYFSISCWVNMLNAIKMVSDRWKDIARLEMIIRTHEEFCATETNRMENLLTHQQGPAQAEQFVVISKIMQTELHVAHCSIVGTSLFYAIMNAAYDPAAQRDLPPDEALQISDRLINQLCDYDDDDASRPPYRIFLQRFGNSRMENLERILTNFIFLADHLTLQGIPYIGPTRRQASLILYNCKDIVENNAERLRGWEGMHDHFDFEMTLLPECARRLEGMSASAGDAEAMARGCVLTAAAKLVRSLYRIMQEWKTDLDITRRSSTSSSLVSDLASSTSVAAGVAGATDDLPDLDTILSDDLFTNWDNWPQFESLDFPGVPGENQVHNWEPAHVNSLRMNSR